jgi:predicted nucleic acid-binding Zn ribbon protein
MPLRYGTAAATPPNPCMECGTHCRKSKRFCNDSCKELWLKGKGVVLNYSMIDQVALERQRFNTTTAWLEWRRKINVSQPF